MTPWLIPIIVEAACILVFLTLYVWSQLQVIREREACERRLSEMCNRLQAGSLTEYASLRQVVEAKTVPVEPEPEPLPELVVTPTLPDDLGAGRSTYESL
jgi:hypothetical protein